MNAVLTESNQSKPPNPVIGPAVAVIGFFPRIPPDPHQLPNGYAAWAKAAPLPMIAWLRRLAMMELFASGNDVPPNPLGGYGGWQGVVNSRDFRVAVYIRSVQVTWDDAGGPPTLQRQVDVEAGYTPVNSWQFVPPNWQHQTRAHRPGARKYWTTLSATSTSVTLTVVAKVKLWWLYNVLQSAATFHFAPWAIVVINYTIHRSGLVEVTFAGSMIPSQYNYVQDNLHSNC